MKQMFFLVLCLGHFLFSSCDNDDGKKNDIACADIACTEIFVTINVTVKDVSGVAIPLDSFQVISILDNEDLTRELSAEALEMASQNGTYPLFGDEYVSRFQNESLDVIFKGLIDEEEVVNAKFKVGADCCHVQLVEGETDIILEQ